MCDLVPKRFLKVNSSENRVTTIFILLNVSLNSVGKFVWIISRSNLKLGHLVLNERLLGKKVRKEKIYHFVINHPIIIELWLTSLPYLKSISLWSKTRSVCQTNTCYHIRVHLFIQLPQKYKTTKTRAPSQIKFPFLPLAAEQLHHFFPNIT